ncbi:protease inhibitor I42 family protein [Dehalogenimonas etheniformans]|uniref:Proteinase inhibitor I42 chagasin domain-containing protein n=2 Tax=Dehalogenimonas etheniformans TaxID=1536648 RepID=A0A2P5P7D0_9CHLR|nr:protease inhibitor I42 family protein [Dehalogenimonas etheniformans]PPD58179.1 hypothetical protein JP09_005145 [Dehalogenimonas etheniformans]QNT75589.2 protease inhibitor I42 family protein [Dehalogenimonas etheniformans]
MKIEKSLKTKKMLWLVFPLLALTLVLGACATPNADAATNPPTTTGDTENNSYMPPLDNPSKTIRVEYLYDELAVQKHITYDVVIEKSGSLIVTFGSNPSTGYAWQKAVTSNSNISSEYTCQFVAPPSGMVGAAGKQVWTFKTLQPGNTTINFSYSQSWQGGVQNEWTLALNVTVK